MKIAILSFYNGVYERGVERWVTELSEKLAKEHKVIVFQNGSALKKRSFDIVMTALKFEISKVKDKFSLPHRFFLHYEARKIAIFTLKILPRLWKEKPNIIVATNGGWQPAFIRIFTWLSGGKLVIVGHSGKGWDERNNLFCFPDVFVALTGVAEKWAKRVNPFIKVVHIPDAVDLNNFKPIGNKASLELERPIVLSVGALEKNKGFEHVIKAVSRLKKGSLLILGRGSYSDKLKSLAKKLLPKRYLITSVDFEGISTYYRACDVFTLASWKNEAFGMVYLEAMASGLPVVATKDPIREEIIGEAGVMVDPGNAKEYSLALEAASIKNWGNIPRKQAEKYSWDKVILMYQKLFDDLIK